MSVYTWNKIKIVIKKNIIFLIDISKMINDGKKKNTFLIYDLSPLVGHPCGCTLRLDYCSKNLTF